MKRHVNIPVFIPHLGCPNTCVFCNQRTISGVSLFRAEEVIPTIEDALSTTDENDECEIAFFGGSFTGIDKELMIRLLEIGYSYIQKGRVSSLRCSTRPDYISEEILSILKKYGVKTVELGLQSTSERVLALTKRGHGFPEEMRACELIRAHGLSLVGQMMIGLPGSDLECELETARFIINSGAEAARIYPTVVFHGTELCDMAMRGEYKPLDTEDAVKRSAAVYSLLHDNGVKVIRIGLHASENLSDPEKCYAGASHSALGELVLGEFYYEKIRRALKEADIRSGRAVLKVPVGATSRAIGQNKRNKLRLMSEFELKDLRIREDKDLSSGEVLIGLQEGGK